MGPEQVPVSNLVMKVQEEEFFLSETKLLQTDTAPSHG